MIVRSVFEDYIKQIEPLRQVIENNHAETEDFRLSIVHKCKVTSGCLDHDWIRMKESSLNDRQFKDKVFKLYQQIIDAGGLVHDVIHEIEYANEHMLKEYPVDLSPLQDGKIYRELPKEE